MYNFLPVLLIIIFWGIAPILIKKGLSFLSPWQSYFLDTVIACALWIPFGIIFGLNLSSFPKLGYLMIMFLGFAFALYYWCMEKGPVSIIVPIFSASPIVTVIFSMILLHENLTLLKIVSVFLTVIGVVLVSVKNNNFRLKNDKWIYLAVFLTLCWGAEGVIIKYLVDTGGKGTYVFLSAFGQVLAVFVWFLLRKPKIIIPNIPKKYFLPTFVSVLLYNAGYILLSKAMEAGQASIIIPLTNTSLIITVISSIFFLKEKIRLHQTIGIMLVLAGIILLNV